MKQCSITLQCGKPFFSNTSQYGEWTETSSHQNEIEFAMFGEWHFFLTRQQIPYSTDDGLIFFSLNTLTSTYRSSTWKYAIGYTRMKFKKSGIPQKILDKNDDFVYSIPLFCCRFFFWLRRLNSSMFLVLFFC